MSNRINIEVYDAAGTTRLSSLKLSGAQIGSATSDTVITIKNGSNSKNAAHVLLGAIRADYLLTAPVGEDSDTTNERGGELVAEQWLEARLLATDAWVPVGETPADSFDIGALAAGSTQTVRLRLNIPSDADTSFDVYFSLAFRVEAA